MFCAMQNGARWIRDKAANSLNPAQVETALMRLANAWRPDAPPLVEVIEHLPLGEAALLHLLAVSSVCATRLTQYPEHLLWLCSPEICNAPRSYAEMLNDLHQFVAKQRQIPAIENAEDAVVDRHFSALRLWKGREMIRIALREVAGAAPLEETTGELSQIAEICIRRIFAYWDAELRGRYGSPKAEFAILGLGKLGGGELNHSSDVDLLFLYDQEGQLGSQISYHEFFNRLANRILQTFSTPHPAGSLFRVDLRLRPEGSAGPLARSLESMENYYAGFGETWERLALIKARWIAGSRELAYEFLRQLQSFIYPRSASPDLLDEIARLKRRIELEMVGAEKLERDVKLGRGGIREIEFIVQTLQLIHGSRHPFLQEPNMLKALRALRQLDLLPRHEVLTLDNAYRFLRSVEHRLQIEAEQQTHTVPRDPVALRRLALSLGFASQEDFVAALRQKMRAVRPIFERIVSGASANGAGSLKPDDLAIFADPKRAAKALTDLAEGSTGFHIAPRTRQIFRKLRPLLLGWLGTAADPDATLNQFVRFVESYGLRSLFLELLVVNQRLLELLVKTFDASRFASELLIRQPQLLEDITRDPTFGQPRSVAEHLQRLGSFGADAQNIDPVRAYRQRQLLRIILRDILALAEPQAILTEISDLAQACLVFTAQLLGADQITVVALGKFGGQELSYGADLDVVFAGNDARAAQQLVIAMAQSTPDGNIWPLDTRLRPEGESGPLICSLETYKAYYAGRAQLWECQALTRARALCGPSKNEFIEIAKSAWRRAGRDRDFFEKIDSMLERIRRERGTGSDFLDLKTGRGGIIEAEFLVQALQMREDIWEQNWERALNLLQERGATSQSDAAKLQSAYLLLRRCELALRRYENRSVSTLPSQSAEQRKLAIRLGYQQLDAFHRDYVHARETIHALYTRHITLASQR